MGSSAAPVGSPSSQRPELLAGLALLPLPIFQSKQHGELGLLSAHAGDRFQRPMQLPFLARLFFAFRALLSTKEQRLTPRKSVGYAMLEPSAPESLKHRDI